MGATWVCSPGPVSYLYSNALLKIDQLKVSPQASGFLLGNGSLWTLFYEFLCYLFIGGLAALGLLRRRAWVVVIAVILLASLIILTVVPGLNAQVTVDHNGILMEFLLLSVVFLAGSLLYLYREHVPDSGVLALVCGGAFLASLYLPTYGYTPTFRLTASSLGALLIAYPMLWLGAHLPFRRVGSKNDYSYGVYIYAFPLTQLLVIFHAERLGFVPFMVLNVVVVVPFAVASWVAGRTREPSGSNRFHGRFGAASTALCRWGPRAPGRGPGHGTGRPGLPLTWEDEPLTASHGSPPAADAGRFRAVRWVTMPTSSMRFVGQWGTRGR